jgi:hypothetical protein
MEQWCSDCEVPIVRSLGSSMSSSPPIKFTVPLGRSGLILLSSGISYQFAREVYSFAFRFIFFHPIVHKKKPQNFFTLSDLEPSLSVLHNLVSESVVLRLVAGLDFF